MRFRILPSGNLLITADNRDREELAYDLRRGARDTAESTMIENARHGPGYAQYEFVSGDDLCALSDAPFTACRRRLSRRTANPSPLALPSPAKSAASSRPPASLCRPICTSTPPDLTHPSADQL